MKLIKFILSFAFILPLYTRGGLCQFCGESRVKIREHEKWCFSNPNCLKASPCPHCGKKIKHLKKHLPSCKNKPNNPGDAQLVNKYKILKKKPQHLIKIAPLILCCLVKKMGSANSSTKLKVEDYEDYITDYSGWACEKNFSSEEKNKKWLQTDFEKWLPNEEELLGYFLRK